MSSHSPIHFPTFQWTCPFSHLQCFPTFPSFQSAPIPSFIFLLFNNLPFPYSLSYFSYLWINSNSPIHFPTFQWVPPFPHSFSYFFYLSKSSHSRIHFPTFQWASIFHHLFSILLLTFQWAPIPYLRNFPSFPSQFPLFLTLPYWKFGNRSKRPLELGIPFRIRAIVQS